MKELDFKMLFESISGCYLVLAPDSPKFTIIAVSNDYLHATLTNRENIIGKGIFEVFPDNPNESKATGTRNLGESLERVRQGLVPDIMVVQKYDIRRPQAEGNAFEVRYWSPVNSPVLDQNNKLLYIIHRVEDVTEFMRLKQQELDSQDKTQRMEADLYTRAQERRQMEERYRKLTSIVPVGIFHTDKDGKCLYVNETWGRLTQQSFENVKDKLWLINLHPEDQPKVFEAWQRANALNRDSFKMEFRFLTLNNTVTWVIGEIMVEKNESGEIKGYIGTMTDISERKELERLQIIEQKEKEQRQRAQQAEEYRKKLEEFIDTICHEIRNPLSGIYGITDMLQVSIKQMEEQLDTVQGQNQEIKEKLMLFFQNQKEIVAGLNECAFHQKTIVDNVLDLSKTQGYKIELHNVPFDPKHVITSVTQMFKSRLHEKGLTLNSYMPDEEIIVKGDPGRLKQIVLNLISNAIKYTYKGGITILLELRDPTPTHTILYIEVIDTGLGITPKEQSKLFHRFSQAKPFMQTSEGGFGLGLAISKGLVELMGGKIWVESENGIGSKFAFTIVCENLTLEERKLLEQEKPEFSIATPEDSLKILIVEDNLLNQKILLKYMQERGNNCQLAEDGVQALEKWEMSTFDIILMDIEMPRMNGLEATQKIREREQQLNIHFTPIIGLSGNARAEHAKTALEAGMNDYVTKPYHKNELYNCIAKCLTDLKQDKAVVPVNKKAKIYSDISPLLQHSLIAQTAKSTNALTLEEQFVSTAKVFFEANSPLVMQSQGSTAIIRLPVNEKHISLSTCTQLLENLKQGLVLMQEKFKIQMLTVVGDTLIIMTANELCIVKIKAFMCRVGVKLLPESLNSVNENVVPVQKFQ